MKAKGGWGFLVLLSGENYLKLLDSHCSCKEQIKSKLCANYCQERQKYLTYCVSEVVSNKMWNVLFICFFTKPSS